MKNPKFSTGHFWSNSPFFLSWFSSLIFFFPSQKDNYTVHSQKKVSRNKILPKMPCLVLSHSLCLHAQELRHNLLWITIIIWSCPNNTTKHLNLVPRHADLWIIDMIKTWLRWYLIYTLKTTILLTGSFVTLQLLKVVMQILYFGQQIQVSVLQFQASTLA